MKHSMNSFAFGGVLVVALLCAGPALAGPSLPITKPPVLPLIWTGPPSDPWAILGQWFYSGSSGIESARTHEFYDDATGGWAGTWAITGYVSSITFAPPGAPPAPILAFSIIATIWNDTWQDPQWMPGSNRHGESLSLTEGYYTGTLHNVKMTASFALTDTSNVPLIWKSPYTNRFPYIVADNEDQAAWYCWNPADPDPEHQPPGAYYVPTWDFGNIPMGLFATRQLDFSVPMGLPQTDSRYTAIVASYNATNDVLLNRSTSLKISTWLDEISQDTGIAYPEYEPFRGSDVSVFHDVEKIEEQLDFGDAPDPTYPTYLANDGARHIIVPGVFMGALIDAEPDGQPDATATGDDTNNIADEDGVSFPAPLVVGSGAQADVTCSAGGFVWAWIDYDGNGSWAEATDLVFPGTAVTAGLNSLAFTVPGTAAGGYTFARFRFITNQIPLSYTGRVDNGEVEDYQVLLLALGEEPTAELGDAPDSSNSWGVPMTAYPFGGPPGTLANFPTVFVAGSPPFGPLHQAPMAVAWLGPIVTMENEADVGPDQDGINNLVPPIDLPDMDSVGFGPIDDGVLFPISLPHCRATTFIFLVNGFGPPMPMFVNVWFDWNRDGDWNDTMQCPDGTPVPEWAVQNLGFLPAPGLNPVPTTPFFCWHPTLTAGDPLWMRITLAELPWPPAPGGGVAGGDGPAVGYTFGETEDYYVTAYTLDENWDFGDAPDPSFPTLLVSTGAQHAVISNFILGVTVDTEADGQPDATATGDDLNNLADEDGVTVFTSFTISTQGCVDVYLTSGPGGGLLDAWVDFDGDGSWSAGEQVFTNEPLVAGWNSNLCFNVPGSAQLGPTFARFRLSSAGNLPPDGAAQDGEVEDYMVTIYQQGPADIVITNFVVVTNGLTFRWNATNAVVYQPQCTTNQLIATDLVWRALGGTVTGPANEQTDTNAVESQKVYRVIAPYAPPP